MPIPAAGVGKALIGNIGNLVGGLNKSYINGVLITKRANTPEEDAYLSSLKPAPVKFGPAKVLFASSRERAQSLIWTMGPNEWLAASGIGNRSVNSASSAGMLSAVSSESAPISSSFNGTWLIVGAVAVAFLFILRRK